MASSPYVRRPAPPPAALHTTPFHSLMSPKRPPDQIAGWREWVGLPDLGVAKIKAKLDTGARTSALHAFGLETFRRRGHDYARFEVHPDQDSAKGRVRVEARVQEWRRVRSSNGTSQLRPLIHTTIELLGERWEIDLTLTNRDEMGFRMLLGRQALRRRVLIDSGSSFYGGRRNSSIKKASKSRAKGPTNGAASKPAVKRSKKDKTS